MRLRPKRFFSAAAALALIAASALPTLAATHARHPVSEAMPRYKHIFVVMMENHAYNEIINNPIARHINQLYEQYGLATHYYGVTHPSEPNYVAMIGGSTFGITTDNPYTQNVVTAPSLADQLEAAGMTWKSYQQSLPYTGFTGDYYPEATNTLYVSKHNPFLNFTHVQSSTTELQNIVPDTQLIADLQSNTVPNFSWISPDECHDMHGGQPACPYSNTAGDANDNRLIALGDNYINDTVDAITHAPVWSDGNVAIVIVWDENDFNTSGVTGCCDANPGGGLVPAIVVTNNGPRDLRYNTPANHYSMLRTFEKLFGLGCLQYACDSANLKSLAPLFAVDH